MPRYYCDYCDTYLTHDSPSVRKQHNSGYKHKHNVRSYYQQFEEQQTQSLIDQRIKEHLGQTAGYQQVGAAYAAFAQRPRPPILSTPGMPNMGASQMPFIPSIRPPVFPRPAGVPGYGAPPMMPSMISPPGAPSGPMQVNGLPRPPTLMPPTMSAPTPTPGVTAVSTSNGAPPLSIPAMYQANSVAPTSGGFDSYNTNASSGLQMPPTNTASQDSYSYAQTSENSH